MELSKIKKVECVTDTEKVNLMLNSGWFLLKIRENGDFLLGTEDADAEIPLTEREKSDRDSPYYNLR